MTRKKITLSLLMVCCFFAKVSAQIEGVTKVDLVTMSLDAASISAGGFPFDIPFLMKFPVPDNAQKILFKYRIKSQKTRKRNWISFPLDEVDTSLAGTLNEGYTKPDDTRTWKRQAADEKEFVLKCNGLHPNMAYQFYFEIIKSVNLDSGTRLKMKLAMLEKIQEFYSSSLINGYGDPEKTALEQELQSILVAAVNLNCNKDRVLKGICDEKAYTINIKDGTTIGNVFDKIFAVDNLLVGNLTKRRGHVMSLVTTFADSSTRILSEISALRSGNLKLKAASKEALDKPIIAAIDEFKTITLSEGIGLLSQIITDPDKLRMVLNGTGKITNNEILPGTETDFNNLFFLASLLRHLDDGEIRDTVGTDNNHRMFKGIFNIADFTIALNGLINSQPDLKTFTAAKENLINQFPDLSLEIVTSEAAIFETITLSDVMSSKTPYISAEGGIGYAPSFETAFNYYGANFYFSPINKKAKLSSFKGINKWAKMACINVSILNFFGSRPKNSYSFLGENASSDIMLGLGLRVSRILKFNCGWLPYKTNNPNPLLDRKIIKSDFIVSAGLDINLLGAFSDVAKALNLVH